MNEIQRNPIITFHGYNIKFIGDCHLGKIFRTGVPSSKYNLREEQIFKDFEYHMDQGKNCLFTVIVGDLFNSFKVSNEVLLKAYNTLCKYINKESYTSTIIIIPGNHDLSKDSTKISSYFLLKEMLENTFDKYAQEKFKILYSDSYLTSKNNLSFYFDCYNPFYEEEENTFDLDIKNPLLSVGHWDDPRFNSGYRPCPDLISKSEIIVSGHIHTPQEFNIKNTKFIYTGSLQPYSHSEDYNDNLYVTYDYKDFETLFTELDGFNESPNKELIHSFKNKNIRINCYPGYISPYSFEFMSLIYNNIFKNETEIEEVSDNIINDFSTLYLLTLNNEYNINSELLTNINNFLKGSIEEIEGF